MKNSICEKLLHAAMNMVNTCLSTIHLEKKHFSTANPRKMLQEF
jgi:hypothetical protein